MTDLQEESKDKAMISKFKMDLTTKEESATKGKKKAPAKPKGQTKKPAAKKKKGNGADNMDSEDSLEGFIIDDEDSDLSSKKKKPKKAKAANIGRRSSGI
jgi:hypothetical protein